MIQTLGGHVIEAEQVHLSRDLPVQYVIGLQLEVEELAHVALIGTVPLLVVHGGCEVGAFQQWRDVIEDGS